MRTDETIDALLGRGVTEVIEREHLVQKLRSAARPLRVKHGVDPTSNDLHLGYTVVYRKLKAFQDAGHTVVFLIGDFTARFGDPNDRLETRRLRTAAEVEEAARSYLDQVGLILDLHKTEIRRNSEWYDAMPAEALLRIMSHFTAQRMLERDMFVERMKKGKEIRLQEPIYPVLQAYDSVMLKADLTVIGSDQAFNELQARELQRDYGQEPQDLVLMPLLRGTDGRRKMSQSLGNAISINEPAGEMYGKIMSIPDALIGEYFRLCTDVPEAEVKGHLKSIRAKKSNARVVKATLAEEIVAMYCGRAAAKAAGEEFTTVFRGKGQPNEMPEVEIHGAGHNLLDLLVSQNLVTSRSAGRRLMEQGGVRLDQEPVTDWGARVDLKDESVLQIGPRRFYRIRVRG
ncbi:MAG: tyrosine--tRNA ligase [Candidatus Kerfeldbacteria bacterium]|nr:tyrosine--tRNA ligase [Candidatus Kerfeldbacteria bacterium]